MTNTANPADVRSMPAGPEMDALVAEKVMGYVPATDILVDTRWRKPEGEFSFSFRPSTDIVAAFAVAERMKSAWVQFRLEYGPFLVRQGKLTDGWKLEPGWNSPVCGFGETPQLAICRAALKACMGL